MNLHITGNNPGFIKEAMRLFEYYYPGENIFFIHRQSASTPTADDKDKVYYVDFSTPAAAIEIENMVKGKIDRVLVHSLTPKKAVIAEMLREKYKIKTYWIYFGVDLYTYLYNKGLYELYDDKTSVSVKKSWINKLGLDKIRFRLNFNCWPEEAYLNFIEKLDYFCFWDKYEFDLLKKYLPTDAKWKYFRYFTNDFETTKINPLMDKIHVLVNHSAAPEGNHLTVLKKLSEIGANEVVHQIITPLSYGSTATKQLVLAYGSKYFPNCFTPLTEFLPQKEYFALLNSVNVAILGSKRQHGGNNIYLMLAIGAKVFLRSDNNILQHLKDYGYIVFDFDRDFLGLASLTPLTMKERHHNRRLVLKELSSKEVDQTFKNLFSDVF